MKIFCDLIDKSNILFSGIFLIGFSLILFILKTVEYLKKEEGKQR